MSTNITSGLTAHKHRVTRSALSTGKLSQTSTDRATLVPHTSSQQSRPLVIGSDNDDGWFSLRVGLHVDLGTSLPQSVTRSRRPAESHPIARVTTTQLIANASDVSFRPAVFTKSDTSGRGIISCFAFRF